MSSSDEPRRSILHLITRYMSGGSEQRLRDILSALPDVDHTVVAGEVGSLTHARVELAGAHLDVEPRLRREIDLPSDLLAFARILRRLRTDRPDLVVAHQAKAGILGRAAARVVGVPAVQSLSMAGFGPGYGRGANVAFRSAERLLAPFTSAYAVVGQDLAGRYEGIGARPERLAVIRSGARLPAPPHERSAARAHLLALAGLRSHGQPVIAYVGSLDDRKNILDLPELLERVCAAAGPPCPSLVVAGDGPQRGDLEQLLAASARRDDVALLGHLADPTVVFQGADVVVLLSKSEGLPQVLVQAAAAGTPFVAFAVDGTHELAAAGAEGTVVPFGDLAAAAAAVVALLRSGASGERRIDLSAWEPAFIRQQYVSLLGPLLGLPARAPLGEAGASVS